MNPRQSTFAANDRDNVSALLLRPPGAKALLVLGHGAGAGMDHPFMEGLATRLADRAIATFRYQFPYMEAGRRFPDRAPVLEQTVKAAISAGRKATRGLPLFAGGKSMGGRMTSRAAAAGEGFHRVRGLIFFGFPLHAPGREGTERADHLEQVKLPTLFLQGTRDKLANLDLLGAVIRDLSRRSEIHLVDDADHGFHVRRSSGRSDADAMEELAQVTDTFVGGVLGESGQR